MTTLARPSLEAHCWVLSFSSRMFITHRVSGIRPEYNGREAEQFHFWRGRSVEPVDVDADWPVVVQVVTWLVAGNVEFLHGLRRYRSTGSTALSSTTAGQNLFDYLRLNICEMNRGLASASVAARRWIESQNRLPSSAWWTHHPIDLNWKWRKWLWWRPLHESSVLHLLLNPFREKPIKHFMKNRTPLINIILFRGFRSYDGMSSNQEIKRGALVWPPFRKNLNEFQTPLMAALRDVSVCHV